MASQTDWADPSPSTPPEKPRPSEQLAAKVAPALPNVDDVSEAQELPGIQFVDADMIHLAQNETDLTSDMLEESASERRAA